MSASALVVIDNVFHKILNTYNGFLTEKTHGKILCFILLYLHRFNHLSLFFENVWTVRTGGIIKVLAVVDMVLNYSSLTQVSWQKGTLCYHKYLNVQPLQPFHQLFLYKRGKGSWDDPRTCQKSRRTTLYSVC